MNAEMVRAWNGVVGEGDVVYHLGDFTLDDTSVARAYFAMLNGKVKVLSYPWHHDKQWLGAAESFKNVELVSPMVVLELKHPYVVTLCHYPMEEWDRKFHGGWTLHGHSHGSLEFTRGDQPILDVSVDNAFSLLGEYRPFSFEEVEEIMVKRGGLRLCRYWQSKEGG